MFTPAAIATQITTFVGLVEPEMPALAGLVGVPQDAIDKIQAGLNGLKQSAAAFATADSAGAAGPIVDRIEKDGEEVLAVLATLPLPPVLVVPVRIAQILWPVLLSAAKMVMSQLVPAPVAPPSPAPDPGPAPAAA